MKTTDIAKLKLKDNFVIKARLIHGDKYDYSSAIYIHNRKSITIICKLHGAFNQIPHDHLGGCGCKICGKFSSLSKRTGTTNSFIEKARLVHGDKYSYSEVNYINNYTKVKIGCNDHGEFQQKPNHHLSGRGCRICGRIKMSNSLSLTKAEFVDRARILYGNTYNYDKVNYFRDIVKITIMCKIHGEFKQTASAHLSGHGCKKCGAAKVSASLLSTTKEFIFKAREIHGDKYNYGDTIYIDSKTQLKIICDKHGDFWQTPNHHLRGSGCKRCKESFGERIIRLFLLKWNIQFEQEKSFFGCRDKKKLRYDFYIPSKNLLIEYNGLQHYSEKPRFFSHKKSARSETLKDVQRRDQIKKKFAKNNNIRLVIIPYTIGSTIEIHKKLLKILNDGNY